MAIGSAPEIGVVFRTFGSVPVELRDAWFARVRAMGDVGDDSLVFVERYVGCVPPVAKSV